MTPWSVVHHCIVFIVSLFSSWCRRLGDPLVNPTSPCPPSPTVNWFWWFSAQLYSCCRISDLIISSFSGFCFVFDGLSMLKYGYENISAFSLYIIVILPCTELALRSDFQTGWGLFKIATFQRWMILALSPQLIEHMLPGTLDLYSHKFFSSFSLSLECVNWARRYNASISCRCLICDRKWHGTLQSLSKRSVMNSPGPPMLLSLCMVMALHNFVVKNIHS